MMLFLFDQAMKTSSGARLGGESASEDPGAGSTAGAGGLLEDVFSLGGV